MIRLHLKVLGSIKSDFGGSERDIFLSEDARVAELISTLEAEGIEMSTPHYLVALNGKGILQYPTDQQINQNDVLLIIPPLMGG